MAAIYEDRGDFIILVYNENLLPMRHLHKEVEIIYILEGCSVATVGGREVTLKKGDVFIVFPNQLHFYQNLSPTSFILLTFTADLCPDFKLILQYRVPKHPIVHIADNKRVAEWFWSIIELSKNKPDNPYFEAQLRAYLLLILSWILPLMEFDFIEKSDTDVIKKIIDYCNENFCLPIQLDDLAREFNMNSFFISHLFRQKIGICFVDFINDLRLSEACRKLRYTDDHITGIGLDVGFGSTRSFNRNFLATLGEPPKTYRNRFR